MERLALCLAVTLLGACSTVPKQRPQDYYATAEGRTALGRIAYGAPALEPDPVMEFRARSKGQGAAQGIGGGLGACAQIAADAGPFALVVFVVLTPVCVTVGATVGAITSPSARAVASAEAMLSQGMADLHPNASLHDALAAHFGRVDPAAEPTPAGSDADTVLQMDLRTLRAASNSSDPHDVRLRVEGDFRLVAVNPAAHPAGTVLDEFKFQHAGAEFDVAREADPARRFDEELVLAIDAAVAALAARWPRVVPAPGADSP